MTSKSHPTFHPAEKAKAEPKVKASAEDPCTCDEVERLGQVRMPCPSCQALGLSGWRGKGKGNV